MGGFVVKERLLGSSRASAREEDDADPAFLPASRSDVGKLRRPIDRRTTPGAAPIEDEDGALTTAFSLVDQSASGRPLPPALFARLTAELGVDLTRVRIHDDERAARACAVVGARAFTTGDDIYFADGAYDPVSPAGVELIAHEVAHIAQRQRASVDDGTRLSRPDDERELEADAFARGFVAGNTTNDPASLVNRMRRDGQRMTLPFLPELEQQLGMRLDFVEAYTGDAARLACELMSASAFAVRSIVAFAEPSPQRDVLMHELAHVVQMGGRSGTVSDPFRAGSLSIGDADDATEHDARAAEHGAPVATVSAPDVIRRKPQKQDAKTQPWSLEEAEERFKKFSASDRWLPKRKSGERHVFGKPGTETVRFLNTSAEPFRLADYKRAIQSIAKYKGLSDADLEKDLTEINLRSQGLGLVKVGKTGKRWAWIDPAEKPGDYVEYLLEEVYKHKSTNEIYEQYCDALAVLKHLSKKPTVPLKSVGDKAICTFSKVKEGTILTDAELKKCREALENAIVPESAYKMKKNQWETYFDDVVDASVKFPQAMVGDWFGKIASRDLTDKGLDADPVQVIFADDDLPNDVNHRGDGLMTEGKTLKIMEFKTGPATPGKADDAGEGGKFITQAGAYATIIKKKIKGVKVKETTRIGPFTQCIYVFPTQEMAKKWGPQLKKAFTGAKVSPDDHLVVFPPAGKGIATLKFNPTFQVPLNDETAAHHHLRNPAIVHPGVHFKEIDLKMKGAGSPEVASGEVIFDLDLQGGVKAENVTKKVSPDASGGTVENQKFSGLKSSLDKLFKGRIETDAKLVDGGVAATLTVKPGPSGIPNLQLKSSTVTVSYINGALTVDGAIELSNTKGNLHGKATVTWDGAEFGFKGEATLEEGMVDGLGRTTGTVEYVQGRWKFGIPEAHYTKTLKNITLTGNAFGLEYDTKSGGFSGLLELEADLGMFGKASASAELKDNKLEKATLSYDSPEFTYPAKSDKPAFKGTVGGTIKYEQGKFSGAIRGSANLNIPALKSVAGEEGAGLAVDAHVHADGSYSGTVRTTSPLKFGKHIQVPSVSCTLDKDGSLSGSFEIEIVKIKYLDNARIKCKVTKDGIEIEEMNLEVPFGNEEKGKFWGKLKAGYSQGKGLEIGGEVNYKIKEGMVATGTLEYSTETHEVSLAMTVSEITLMDKTISKTLFKASKQIPVVNIYGLGIYIDIGFDLGFDFGFKLGLKPTVEFDGLSLESWEFKKIQAKLELLGLIYAQLTGTPKLGIGVFALDPSILRGGGGLKVPIVGRLEIKPTGTVSLAYLPGGGVDGEAKIGMAGSFGITGSVTPYAEFAVLDGLWNPTWEGQPLAQFEILKPKELFNFEVDLAGDMTKQEPPALPEENAAKEPSKPTGTKTFEDEKAAPTEHGADAPKNQTTETKPPEGGEDGPFSLTALMDKLKGMPGFETAKKVFEIAKKVWDVVEDVWELVEPLFQRIGDRIEQFIDLFDSQLPKSADDVLPWVWKLAKAVLNLSFGGIVDLADAIMDMLGKVRQFAKKLINRAVTEGWIGVKRHSYYVWKPWPWDNYEFMAASEYKINIPGVADIGHGGPDSVLLTPSSAVALVLYEALEGVGVGYTYVGNSDINEPYNDFWSGAGARG